MSATNSSINLLKNKNFKEFIDGLERISKAAENLNLDEERKLCTQFLLSQNPILEPVWQIKNMAILGRDQNEIPLRIFIPNESKELPILMYFHGGGFVFGNIEESDPVCRKLANHLECIVVSVEYRLAPENPFPKPLNDCYDATLWIAANADSFVGDKKKLIVCGESAGGNLAAAVALMARDKKEFNLAAQILIYPVITSVIDDAPYKSSVDQYYLTMDAMEYFWRMYLQSPEYKTNYYASPDQASNFISLPKALIITAEYDPLHVEAKRYAKLLSQGGVDVISKCFPEVVHGFISLPIYDENQKNIWIDEIAKLAKSLGVLK